MAWTLLSAADGGAESRLPQAIAGSTNAWVLVGPLESALFQVGAVDVLLGALPPPAAVYAAGFSAAIALLLADSRDAMRFRQNWEALRASHLLSIAVVARTPFLRPLLGGPNLLASRLDSLAFRLKALGTDRNARSVEPQIAIELMAAAGFETLEARHDPMHRSSLLSQTLAWGSAAQEAVGLAIERASSDHDGEIIVIGAPVEEIEAVEREPLDPRQDRRALSLLPRGSLPALRLAEVMIAGSGAVERRIQEGRSAAQRWLGSAPHGVRAHSAGVGATVAG